MVEMMAVGGLIGAGCHQLVERYVLGGFFRPIRSFLAYYVRIAEISSLMRTGIISRRQGADLLREVTDRYFLGTQAENPPLLPPS